MTDKKFKNPPVKEIICQFRFSPPEEHENKIKKQPELIDALKSDYPDFELSQERGVGFHIKESSISPEFLPTKPRLVFRDSQNNYSITVAPDSFAFIYKVSKEHTYKTWEKSFQPNLQDAWSKVKPCLDIKQIQSIGVRYINHIDSSYELEPHETLNKESEYLPKALVSEHYGFFNRSEIAKDEKNRMMIQTGVMFDEEDSEIKWVILDIDRIYKDSIDIIDEALPEKIGELQQDVENVFLSSTSDALKEKMKQEPMA